MRLEEMQLVLPGEGKSHCNHASWHNDNTFCLGWGEANQKSVMQNSIPPGGWGSTPPRCERNENPVDYKDHLAPGAGAGAGGGAQEDRGVKSSAVKI